MFQKPRNRGPTPISDPYFDAIILFCDLRASSTLAEHYDLKGFLGVLNDYYEISAGG